MELRAGDGLFSALDLAGSSGLFLLLEGAGCACVRTCSLLESDFLRCLWEVEVELWAGCGLLSSPPSLAASSAQVLETDPLAVDLAPAYAERKALRSVIFVILIRVIPE